MMSEAIKIALIAAIPPSITALAIGLMNRGKLNTIEVNTNDKLSKLLDQLGSASKRADFAEGRQEGAASERDKQP